MLDIYRRFVLLFLRESIKNKSLSLHTFWNWMKEKSVHKNRVYKALSLKHNEKAGKQASKQAGR